MKQGIRSKTIQPKSCNNMLIHMTILLGIIPLVLILTITFSHGETHPPEHNMIIKLNGEKLTALIDGAPWEKVMEKLSRSTGVEIVWYGEHTGKKMWANVINLPVDKAFKRIFLGENYAFNYTSLGEGNAPDKILIFSSTKGREKPVATANTIPKVAMPVAVKTSVEEIEESPKRIEADDETKDWVESVGDILSKGDKKASEEILVSALTSESNPKIRMLALEGLIMFKSAYLSAIIDTAENDPEPSLRTQAAEYLAMRNNEDPRIHEIIPVVTESDSHSQTEKAFNEL
jgi:hypothetical protein